MHYHSAMCGSTDRHRAVDLILAVLPPPTSSVYLTLSQASQAITGLNLLYRLNMELCAKLQVCVTPSDPLTLSVRAHTHARWSDGVLVIVFRARACGSCTPLLSSA